MTFDELLGLLAQFNLFAWVIAAIMSFLMLRYTQNKGWVLIMMGSLFVVLRQSWKLLPAYKLGQPSEELFNGYMMRYIVGSVGAMLLIIGFITLIVSYYVLKSRLEQ